MRVLRTSLVGCGRVSATHAQALATLPMSHLVSVCDSDLPRARRLGDRFGAAPYSDFAEMLSRERPDVVAITTPHPSHPALIEAAASARVHVLCEKPLAIDLLSCDRALEAAARAGIKLGCVSQRRYYEPVRRIKSAIQEGKIGKPALVEATVLGWRDEAYYRSDPWRGTWQGEGGGVMVNQCAHQLDLLLWLMGPVAELYGCAENLNHPYIEVDDTAAAILRFCGGALGCLLLSNSQKPGLYGRIHVHGSNGASVGVQVESGAPFIAGVTPRVDPPHNHIWTVPGEEHLLDVWRSEDAARQVDVMTHYHRLQIEDFLLAVLEDREPAVTGWQGRAVVELFSAVYHSHRLKRPVTFPL